MSPLTSALLHSIAATMVWLVNMADGDRSKRNSSEAPPHQQQQELPEAGIPSYQGLLEAHTCPLDPTLTQWLCSGLQLSPALAQPVHPRTTGASRPAGSTSSSTSWGHCIPQSRAGKRSRRCQALGRRQTRMTMRRVSVQIKTQTLSASMISAKK